VLTNITQLKNKTVVVKPNTVFSDRLKSVNQETGGKINVQFAPDSLSSEDLIELVANDSIKYTFAFYNTAMLFKNYYPNLNVKLHVGFNQRNGWLVSNQSVNLQKEIEKWEKQKTTKKLEKKLYDKYWKKNDILLSNKQVKTPKGAISPYDAYFKQYAGIVDWDWRLLAALAFQESRFDPSEVSWAGAVGLMQLMPFTAQKMGLETDSFFNAQLNIKAGAKYLKSLDRMFGKIEDKNERVKFMLASYNSGPAHVLDAIALAVKHDKNPASWEDVEYFYVRKNEPEFYNDPVVKYGSYRGTSSASFVRKTLGTYNKYLGF
jgi:membrane-bound lytic murein transglycosylase F